MREVTAFTSSFEYDKLIRRILTISSIPIYLCYRRQHFYEDTEPNYWLFCRWEMNEASIWRRLKGAIFRGSCCFRQLSTMGHLSSLYRPRWTQTAYFLDTKIREKTSAASVVVFYIRVWLNAFTWYHYGGYSWWLDWPVDSKEKCYIIIRYLIAAMILWM